MIEAINSTLTYADGTEALKKFDLNISKGEIVYITGPSGSGKTSLLKLMMGMEFPTSGKFDVMGVSIAPTNKHSLRTLRMHIGPVFQQFRLLEGRSVLENVMLGMRFLDFSTQTMKDLAYDSITKVGLLHKINHTTNRLSWGECQRVSIARAVARQPKLIIADEPTGNLDETNAYKILKLLTSFQSDETTIIIVTHATHLLSMNPVGTLISMNEGNLTVEKKGIKT